MKLQVMYSVCELARLAGLTRRRMLTLLKESGVPARKVGGRLAVFASDIKACQPALWESMVALDDVHALRRSG